MANPRAVVIGYGYAGRAFHSYLIGLDSGLELAGVASRDPATRERIGKERAVRAYESFEEVLADPSVDLVVLATPHDTHAALAARALEAGKHVVTDKVMCLNLAEYERMAEAARRAGRLLTVFHNRRFDGDYLTVRRLMAEGRLGRVRRVEMAWGSFGIWGGWRGRRAAGGGKLYDLGAHMVDQLCMILPQRVTSVTARLQYDHPEYDVESDAVVLVGFEGGATGLITATSILGLPKPRFYVAGTAGAYAKLGVDPQEAAMNRGDIDDAAEPEAAWGRLGDGKTETVVPTERGRWRNYYENVAAALTAGAEPAVKLSEMRRTMGVLDAAFRSAAAGGETIRVDLGAAE